MNPYYQDDLIQLFHGDCLDVLRAMPDASVHAIVTDPPYSLTDRREQYCAGDVLRDAIIMDAQHNDAERTKSLVTLRITVAPSLAMRVRGVHLDRHVAAGQEEVDDDGTSGRQDDDVLIDEGDAVTGEERLGGSFRLWVRQGVARCIGACRCLGQHGDGLIRVPVRLRHDALGEAEGSPGIVALGGAELAAVLALDVARLTGELLPASGADALDQPFELLCPEEVGAGAGARRLASVTEAGGVGGVGDSADRALSFDLVAHRAVLSWRPTVLRGFMSSLWDGTGVETDTRLWRECLRVLKPGGHCLAFGSPRTWHNLQTAIEQSGFEIRDGIAWMYGSGMPKSLDVSKAIDKAAGTEGTYGAPKSAAHAAHIGKSDLSTDEMNAGWDRPWMHDADAIDRSARTYEGGTEDARRWQGWGTALKPSHEPIVVARKPLSGTVAGNVLEHGTGALNIDATRIPGEVPSVPQPVLRGESGHYGSSAGRLGQMSSAPGGRWPANVVLDDSQAAELDRQSGVSKSPAPYVQATKERGEVYNLGSLNDKEGKVSTHHGDTGAASRFFYVAKAPKSERPNVDGTAHPTVKPLALMRWLVRLVTPPGGVVLDPFAGSGTTLEAATLEGFTSVGIEREADYLPLIEQRIERAHKARAERAQAGEQDALDLGGIA